MKQLLVLSGKGGTGKTTVAASLIALAGCTAFADLDVDAPNLHLIHGHHSAPKTEDWYGYEKAVLDPEICSGCGACEAACRFGAIRNLVVDPYACEGCGVCEAVCPVFDAQGNKAIRLRETVTGTTMMYREPLPPETATPIAPERVFATAELQMGSGASGKLVSAVRKNLYDALGSATISGKSDEAKNRLVVLDGSPGIGCPVIASVTGVDAVLIVTEPTVSGLHDLSRLAQVAEGFGVPCMVCINRYDLHPGFADRIEAHCKTLGIPVLARIPYDKAAVEAVTRGIPLVEIPDSPAALAIRGLWDTLGTMRLGQSGSRACAMAT
jgi:MinD superfamily P-loop ATPase